MALKVMTHAGEAMHLNSQVAQEELRASFDKN